MANSGAAKNLPSLESFLQQDAIGAMGSWADSTDQDASWAAALPEPKPLEEIAKIPQFKEAERGPQAMDDDYIPSRPPYRTYVGNLPYTCTEDDVYDFFNPLEIESIRMVNDNHSKRFKGFCYVDFKTPDAMREALKRHDAMMDNRTIRVDHADRPKNERRGGGGGGDRGDRRGGGGSNRAGGRGGNDFWSNDNRRHGGFDSGGSGGGGGRHVNRAYSDRDRSDRGFSGRDRERPYGHQEKFEPPADTSGKTRRKLNLLPRTKPVSAPAASSGKAAPFGEARPREAVLAARHHSETDIKAIPPKDETRSNDVRQLQQKRDTLSAVDAGAKPDTAADGEPDDQKDDGGFQRRQRHRNSRERRGRGHGGNRRGRDDRRQTKDETKVQANASTGGSRGNKKSTGKSQEEVVHINPFAGLTTDE